MRIKTERLLAVGIAVSLLGVGGCGGSSGGGGSGGGGLTTTPGSTASTGLSLGTARALHTATLLQNGAIFVAGGVDSTGSALSQTALVTATTVKPGPALLQARVGHGAALLHDGRVVLVGGQSSTNAAAALGSTEVYDPLAGSVSKGPDLTTPRSEAVAVTFGSASSQQVLVAGGTSGSANLGSAEVLDFAAGKATALPSSLAEPVSGAGAALMDDGTVVMVGGTTPAGTAGAEVFDPTTGTFTAVNVMVRRVGGALVANGSEALVAGGQSTIGPEATTESYNLASRAFVQSALLDKARRDAAAVRLPNGLAIVGGRNASAALSEVEILTGSTFASSTVTGTTALATGRYGHTATVVNGSILVIGGFNGSGAPLASIENVNPSSATPPPATTPPPPATTPPPPPSTAPLPAPPPASSGSGGILGSLLGGITSGGLGGILGKVATAGIQTILTQGFSGGISGILTGFISNLLQQFFPPGSVLGGIVGAIFPSSSSGSSGGLLVSLLGGIFGGGSSTPAPAGPAPAIVAMTPTAGKTGSVVTITGTNLGTSGDKVTFTKSSSFLSSILGIFTGGGSGTTSATVTSIVPGSVAGTTVITCTVPSDAATGDVTVTSSTGAQGSAGTYTVQ